MNPIRVMVTGAGSGVGQGEGVGLDDGGGDRSKVVRVEGAWRGAARAVYGGVARIRQLDALRECS